MNLIEMVRKLLALVLEYVPHDLAQQLLTEEAVKRQNAIADTLEGAKFG